MKPGTGGDVTQLLEDLAAGRQEALPRLLPLIYDELRRLAAYQLRRERPNHTLQPTALVHEAYLRLAGQRSARWQGRAHFLAVASQAMRRVLVDHARAHGAAKRGEGQVPLALDTLGAPAAVEPTAIDVLALDEALDRLADDDPRPVRIVELRYFGGLSLEETAEVLGISLATVKREWTFARAWLRRALTA